jgi:hypothetical protein
MDRSKLQAQDTTRLEVTKPNGAATDMVVILRSMDSPEAKKVLRKWDKVASRNRRRELDFDQKEEASVELLSACIEGWEGYDDDGEIIECNDEERRILLTDPSLKFIRSQIDETLGDVGSFLAEIGNK